MTRLLAILALSLTLVTQARADTFPSRSITIIVGVAPGGTLDALARIVAKSMSETLKQPVIVENLTGAGGLLGFQRLNKSAPDGYTLMFSNMSMVLIPLLYPKAGIDVVTDVTPIGTVATVPMVLGMSNKSGITSLPVLLERMKSGAFKPDSGSGGPGTTAHLAEAMFMQMSGGKGELIPYRGTGPALVDLMAGTIDLVLDQTVTMMPGHKDGRLKAIAVSSPQRLAQMPDVPTFAEGGLPQFDLQIWNGVVAPKGTPKAVIDALNGAIGQMLASAEYKDRLDQFASQLPAANERDPASFHKLLVHDQKSLAELAKQIGLQSN